MKIAFMSSGGIGDAVFKTLLASNHIIEAVYTNPPKPSGRKYEVQKTSIHQMAESCNIPVRTPVSFKDDEVKKQFLSLGCDIAVIVSYGKIVPDYVINLKYQAINLHPSALPKYRGAAPIERCIQNGENYTEICTMFVTNELDAGGVIARRPINISPNTTSSDIYREVDAFGGKMILDALHAIETGYVKQSIQIGQASYAKKIDKSELHIHPNLETALQAYNKIRAFDSCGHCYIEIQSIRIKIIKAEVKFCNNEESLIGTIDSSLNIYFQDGVIMPKTVQKQGGKPMEIENFLKGWRA